MQTLPDPPSSIRSPGSAQPTISVALCTFNGARFLAEQLRTIAAQTRLPLELVVVDDGSTDGTLAMLEEFAASARFPVHIHRNPQRLGSTPNFDRCIRLCRGEYIALADQDDRWRESKLERLGSLLDREPGAAMSFSDATLIDDGSNPTGGTLWHSLRFPPPIQARFLEDAAAVLLERPVVTGATMLFRRALLGRFDAIPAEWVHDGWIAWMSVLWGRAVFTPEPLTEYRVHTSQQLGVGETSLRGRVRHILGRQRTLYARAAAELDLLRRYVQRHRWPEPSPEARVAAAAAFFRVRAESPAHRAARLPVLFRQRLHYRAMSGYRWRAVLRDLLMD